MTTIFYLPRMHYQPIPYTNMVHSIPKTELIRRQTAVLHLLPANQALLILANQNFCKNSDTDFRFRQDSNFWYFTGFDEDSSCLFFIDSKVILFVKEKKPEQEVWTGEVAGLEVAKEMVGADEVYPFVNL